MDENEIERVAAQVDALDSEIARLQSERARLVRELSAAQGPDKQRRPVPAEGDYIVSTRGKRGCMYGRVASITESPHEPVEPTLYVHCDRTVGSGGEVYDGGQHTIRVEDVGHILTSAEWAVLAAAGFPLAIIGTLRAAGLRAKE